MFILPAGQIQPMEIVIVPVAHVSEKSARNVRTAIEETKPDVVAIELDAQRLQALLHHKEPTLGEMVRSPFFALLYLFQTAVGKGLRVAPGGEMLAAVEAARDANLPIALIDRDISITMGRLSAIPLWEKLSIVAQIFLSPLAFIPNPFSKQRQPTIDEMTDQRFITGFFGEFKRQLPNVYRVLVEERDEYISRRLLALKAGKVVLVVGAGHVPGITKRLKELGVGEEKAVVPGAGLKGLGVGEEKGAKRPAPFAS